MNAVHVRDQKHELTPPRDSLPVEEVLSYSIQLAIGLKDEPQHNKTLYRNLKTCQNSYPGRTRCLCRDIPFVILLGQIVEALA
ncbi:hypothetical protein V6N12_018530 [Hibiscus sabdariffa]|uniref:Uncharacterized protein n=1 Tax=Hibiscus sabdariffa TaxID=183260 RepID=A0ABR2BYP6_9ROSI